MFKKQPGPTAKLFCQSKRVSKKGKNLGDRYKRKKKLKENA